MADELTADPTAPSLADLAEAIVGRILTPETQEKLRRFAQDSALARTRDSYEVAQATSGSAFDWALAQFIDWIASPGPLTETATRIALRSMGDESDDLSPDARAIGERLIALSSGRGGTMEPGYEAASTLLGKIAHDSVRQWAGTLRGSVLSGIQLGPIQAGDTASAIDDLTDILDKLLGGEQIPRQVLGAILETTVVTPARWQTEKTYRPQLLGAEQAIRHFLRGGWHIEILTEELARQGWSNERIDILIRNATKRLGVAEEFDSWLLGGVPVSSFVDALREMGYDADTAQRIFEVQRAKERARLNAPLINELVTAFLNNDVDESTFSGEIRSLASNYDEGEAIVSNTRARRALRKKGLTSGEARRLATKRLMTPAQYEDALRRENYDEEAVAALGLELRLELDDQDDREAARAEVERQRAAEQAEREAERARTREVVDGRTVRVYASIGEFRRAAVRGLITIDRYAAELRRLLIAPDDVAFLVQDVTLDRAEYLDAEERRARAEAETAQKGAPLSDLRQLAMRGIIDVGDYRNALLAAGYSEPAAQQMTALLQAEIDDRTRAEARRIEAEERAAVRGISLGELAAAVRRGLRPIDDYGSLLASLGYGDADRATLVALLQAQIDDDEAARQQRAAAEERATARGISLADLGRAVKRGIRPMADYRSAVQQLGFGVGDTETLVALLQGEIDDATAAAELRRLADERAEAEEARRAAERERAAQQRPPITPPPGLSQAQILAAVRLGLLDMPFYRSWLTAAGYTADEAEILVALLVEELRATREAQERRAAVAGELQRRGVSLGEAARAVKRGLWTLGQYEGLLADSGYGGADLALLAGLLRDEVEVGFLELRSRLASAWPTATGAPTFDDYEARVVAGAVAEADAVTVLQQVGLTLDEARLYVRLLQALWLEG